MAVIEINLEGGDGAFADVNFKTLGFSQLPIRVAVLPDGTLRPDGSRTPSVAIGIFLPNDGGCVVGETTLAMFLNAADVLKARYGDPRGDPRGDAGWMGAVILPRKR